MMIEAWIAITILSGLAWFGLMHLINKCFAMARSIRVQKAQQRLRLRTNFNTILLTMLIEDDDASLEMLRQAYVESIVEYRRL